MIAIQCVKCGWADFGLGSPDAEMKAAGHKIKTGCDGSVRVREGRRDDAG